MKFYAKDWIALVVIIGGLALLWKGADGYIQGMMALILGYYFARRDNINGKK